MLYGWKQSRDLLNVYTCVRHPEFTLHEDFDGWMLYHKQGIVEGWRPLREWMVAKVAAQQYINNFKFEEAQRLWRL